MLQLGPAADVTRCVAHVSAPPDEMSALIRPSHFHYDSYYVAQKVRLPRLRRLHGKARRTLLACHLHNDSH
jgi:hypothetical protein